jgi:hypothetical protein
MEAMKEILEVINRSLEGTQFRDQIDGFFKYLLYSAISLLFLEALIRIKLHA